MVWPEGFTPSLRLAESVGHTRLEAACRRARYYGDVRYRRVKDILNAALDQEPLPTETVTPAYDPERTYAFARSGAEFFDTAEVAG